MNNKKCKAEIIEDIEKAINRNMDAIDRMQKQNMQLEIKLIKTRKELIKNLNN